MRPFYRRRYFVRPFQVRLILFQACYFFLVAAALYWFAIAPMLDTVQDKSLPVGRRASSADFLLFFDRHALPVLAPLLFLLFAHSVIVSHRVAGPLYRFTRVWRAIGAGDLSMRVRVRPRDYLQEEAHELDRAVAALRERLQSARAESRRLEAALASLGRGANDPAYSTLVEARDAARKLARALESFTLEEPAAEQRDARKDREAA